MDAISFVLGVKTAQLRSTQLKDLVFRTAALAPEGAGEGAAADDKDAPDRASVTAVIEDAKGVEHRFQRTITPAGSSEFRYNGRVVSYTLYNQRLEQLNILVKVRNFLVFQGDVEAIAAQCSKDLSEVVDEVSGSRALAGEYDAARTAYDASVAHSSALVTKRKNLLAEVRAFRQQKEAADRLDAVKLELHAHLVQQMLWRLYHIHEITEIHTDWIEAHAARNEQLRRRHDEREAQVATARADAGRVQQAILAQEAEEKKLTRAIDAARPEREKLEERLAHAQHKRKQAATLCAQAERDRDAHDATLARLETHASRAEASVGDITAEIRWLDTAKRNVAHSIVTLKRLQMLVNSTFHLEQLCAAEAFASAAQTLQAVQALLEYFAPYSAVEVVAQQRRRVDELRDDLRRKAMHAYEHAFQSARPHWDASDTPLPDAARAIDALGDETRTALIDWYCARQLREYRRVFRAVDEAGQLDNVARRYAWIRRMLRTYADEHSAAFLPAWHVDQRLLSLFAEITRDDLKSVLVRQQPRLDADLLLGALNATNEFEAQVARQYARPFAEVVAAHRTAAAAAGQPLTIAASFTPYLHVFVDAQERRLGELFAQFGAHASTGEAPAGSFEAQVAHHAEEPMKVLLSSTELFWFYRQTLERCAQLGEHAPFRELAALFARWLRRYVADVLQPALAQRHADADAHVRAVCLALNTADYCATTCTQLEQKLNEKVRDADTHPVSLDGERQAFYAVVAGALQHLCRALYHATDAAFQQMLRPEVPWAHVEHVTERSPYMDALAAALEHVGVVVRHEVENKRVVRSWCDKAVAIVVTRFVHTVVRLRPVRQRVAAQLRADVDALATLLRELPQFGTHVWSGTPNLAAMHAAYDRIVDKQIARVAPVLAVLAAVPDDAPQPDALVHTYRTHLHDQSLGNFQKVLDLKGLKRLDQTPLVEAFLAAIDREPEPLPTTSALSHWSMDPAADTYAPPELPSERRSARDDAHEPAVVGASDAAAPTTPTNAAAARLPDWMRFGSMLGAALGRSQRP